jgi:aldehyde:ferredoxin oxidoreductase
MARWPEMLRSYYTGMGWDPQNGRPLPETLERLGLREFLGA